MTIRKVVRRGVGPDQERLHRDKEVTVYRRATDAPTEFVPVLSLREGVTLRDLLRCEDEDDGEEESSDSHAQR